MREDSINEERGKFLIILLQSYEKHRKLDQKFLSVINRVTLNIFSSFILVLHPLPNLGNAAKTKE